MTKQPHHPVDEPATSAPRADNADSPAQDLLPSDQPAGDVADAPAAASLPGAAIPATPVAAQAAPGDRQGMAIMMMCAVSLIFAVQDALGRTLGGHYPAVMVVMLRYWFFALFVVVMAARSPGGLRGAMRSRRPFTQIFRGLLLVTEVLIMLVSFVSLGLVETHAIFTASPLLVVALSGPILGEKVGWRRWVAVGIGFVGILIILQPGMRVFSLLAALPLISALMFAVYGLLTRKVGADDSADVSFFWTGIAGAIGITIVGIWKLEPMAPEHWPIMLALCLCAIAGHWMLIRAYQLAEASMLQPFAYTQLVWITIIGFAVFGERVAPNVIVGATIIVAAGMFTWWRNRQLARMRKAGGEG